MVVMEENVQVRLKNDPSVAGIVTGKKREKSAGRFSYEVNVIGKGKRYFPLDQLEIIEIETSISDDIANGKFSNPEALRTILIHIQLTGRLADMVYSMESTNTDFHAYQFKPVLKLINSTSQSLLIADEVGLGKTIEAGLIWTELKARFDSKNLIVMCPFALTKKWKDELLNKFDVKSIICKADELLEFLNNKNLQQRGAAYICGMQSIRPDKGWDEDDTDTDTKRKKQKALALKLQELESENPIFDLLIVDEAHHLRNEITQLNAMGKLLRNVSEHCIFLSATPIHLKNNDLLSQLSLLDPGYFSLSNRTQARRRFEALIDANRPIIKARDIISSGQDNISEAKSYIEEALENNLLQNNITLKNCLNEISNCGKNPNVEVRTNLASKLDTANLLSNIITRTRRRDVQELRIIRRVNPVTVEMTETEREFYDKVTRLVSDYADKKNINQRFLLASPQRMMSSCMYGALHHWRKSYTIELEDVEDNLQNELEAEKPLIKFLSDFTSEFSLEALYKNDTKFQALIEKLKSEDVSKDKVILFSSFKPSLKYLEKRLIDEGFLVFMIHGESKNRDAVLSEFESIKHAAILLSSEVGSEGLDLQFCRILINYDLPWNPMRVEQRIGRVDRFGQASDFVEILNFIHNDTIDQRIWDRLYDRLKLCEEALGGFEDILGEEIRKLEREILNDLTPEEQVERIKQTEQAISTKKKEHENLEKDASGLMAHGDYILNQVTNAHKFNRWLTQEDIENYLIGFFKEFYPKSKLSKDIDEGETYSITIDNKLKYDLTEFCKTLRVGIYTNLQFSDKNRVYIGKPKNIKNKKYEVINQQHPIIRFAIHTISLKRKTKLRIAVASEIYKDEIDIDFKKGRYCLVVQQWSIFGTVQMEKLSYLGQNLINGNLTTNDESEQLVKTVIMKGKKTNIIDYDNDNYSEVSENLFKRLSTKYENYVSDYRDEIKDKANFQIASLNEHKTYQTSMILNTIEKLRSKKVYEESEKKKTQLDSLIKAQKGRINKLDSKIAEKLMKINDLSSFTEEYADITAIILDIK